MRAISVLRREAGMSTRVCLAVTALRIRVSISAIGSVISLNLHLVIWSLGNLVNSTHQLTNLPTALRHSCDVALQGQLAEAQAAQRELPHVGSRAAAQV